MFAQRELLILTLLPLALIGCADKAELKLTAREEAALAGIKQLEGRYSLTAGEVTGVDLSSRAITDADLIILKDLKSIHTLSLNNTPITDAGLIHLKGLTDLQRLYLDGTLATNSGLKHLRELTKLRSLWLLKGRYKLEAGEVVEISIDSNRVTDSALERHIEGLKRLRSLQIRSAPITDLSLQHMARLPNLERLYIKGGQTTDAGLDYLAGLSKLEYLGLDSTQISLAAVYQLSIALPQLRISHRLQQSPNEETNEPDPPQGKLISKLKTLGGHYALKAAEVVELNFSDTDITDDDLKNIKTMTQLRTLVLSNTQISDAGLKHLEGHTSLQNLYISDTLVSEAGANQLKNTISNLTTMR